MRDEPDLEKKTEPNMTSKATKRREPEASAGAQNANWIFFRKWRERTKKSLRDARDDLAESPS